MSTTPTHDEALAKIQDLIKDTHIAMLTTAGSDGKIYSRPYGDTADPVSRELWFLTRQDSGKVDEIRHDSHVNVAYSDTKSNSFVSLSGHAEVSKDRARIHELWNPMYKAWFPDGVDDPQIAAIKVTIADAEYWDVPASSIVLNYQIMKAALTKGNPRSANTPTSN